MILQKKKLVTYFVLTHACIYTHTSKGNLNLYYTGWEYNTDVYTHINTSQQKQLIQMKKS